MSNVTTVKEQNMHAVESALVLNDLSKMSVEQRLTYYKAVCESVGLNHMTQPFAYITLQGKITLYARRDAADQLRKIHGVSIQILEKKVDNGLYIVSVRAKDKTGRTDEATGIIPIDGLKGSDLANTMLKTETKAKRRVTLSICGLGIIDESELDAVSGVGFSENPQAINPFKPIDVMPKQATEITYSDTIFEDAPENDLGEFEVRIGKKYLGQKLKDMDQLDLDGYVKWILDDAKKKMRNLPADYQEFVEVADAYLKSKEAK